MPVSTIVLKIYDKVFAHRGQGAQFVSFNPYESGCVLLPPTVIVLCAVVKVVLVEVVLPWHVPRLHFVVVRLPINWNEGKAIYFRQKDGIPWQECSSTRATRIEV